MSLERILSVTASVAKYAVGSDIHPYWTGIRAQHTSDPSQYMLRNVNNVMGYFLEAGRYVHRFLCLVNEGALAYSLVKHPEIFPLFAISELFLRGSDYGEFKKEVSHKRLLDALDDAKRIQEMDEEGIKRFKANSHQIISRVDSSARRYQRLADYLDSRQERLCKKHNDANIDITKFEIRDFVSHLEYIRKKIPDSSLIKNHRNELMSKVQTIENHWLRYLAGIGQ